MRVNMKSDFMLVLSIASHNVIAKMGTNECSQKRGLESDSNKSEGMCPPSAKMELSQTKPTLMKTVTTTPIENGEKNAKVYAVHAVLKQANKRCAVSGKVSIVKYY